MTAIHIFTGPGADAAVPTSVVLNRAADLIEERGWTKGEGWHHENGGPLCLEGGILAAIGGSVEQGDHYICPAYKAVRDYLSTRTTSLPFIWNDNLAHDYVNAAIDAHDYSAGGFDLVAARAAAHEYAKTEVIATLRAAALIEDAKEAEACALALGVAADAGVVSA